MIQEMIAMSVGGSSGSNVASGDTVLVNGTETTSVSGASTEFKVNTGLSSISRFYLVGNTPDASYPEQSVLYDTDIVSGYQYVTLHHSSSPAGGRLAVPTSTISGQAPCIKSISGGEVTLSTSSNATYASMTKIHWYAE